jgi:plasmid stability protein
MTDLSPAAEAVMEAFLDAAVDAGDYYATRRGQLSAVVRIIADQVAPSDVDEPRNYLPMALESERIPMTDYKATKLCARMADELDHYRQLLMDDRRETHALATEARAALAQPEPEGPSDKELDLVVIAIQALIPPQPDATTHHLSAVDRGREILRQRLARWGNL